MYEKPQCYQQLLKTLRDTHNFEASQARTLLQVEMGLYLLQYLCLDDEPITTLWVILSESPIRDIRLQALSDRQKRAIANSRVLLPYSGRFSWQAALRDYSKIEEQWRSYIFDAGNLERQIVDSSYKPDRYPERFAVYRQCLESTLTHSNHSIKPAKAEEYSFEAETRAEEGIHRIPIKVRFSETQAAMANEPLAWFNEPRSRQPISISLTQLQAVAAYIDQRENSKEWTSRLQAIRYCAIHDGQDGKQYLGQENTKSLTLNGMVHIAGMVASGKSTLMTLIAAYAIWAKDIDWRVTLIVGDTMSALKLADRLNCWFRDNAETDAPVAVAILGRTTRDRHLRQFYSSKDYRPDHWGHRWLNTACPLQALVEPEQLDQPIIPGREPCGSLRKPALPGEEGKSRTPYSCPLFARCPSQQIYRDMPQAQVWVTTPGALGSATLPAQIEPRTVRLGDIVYEQSDIVVFDEVDTIQEWFDGLLAQEVKLVDGGNGILDELDEKTARHFQQNRIPSPPRERWIGAERQSVTAVAQILRQINRPPSQPILEKWLNRNYFTALSLFYKLARRLAGLQDFENPNATPKEIEANNRKVQRVMRHFDVLLEVDPLNMASPEKRPSQNAPYQLAQIMQFIMTNGDGTQVDNIQARCQEWIVKFVPDIHKTLDRLQVEYEAAHNDPDQANNNLDPPDTLEILAQQLAFVLSVALLDRNIRIVFYEWHNRPESIDQEQPHRRSPRGLANILPLPPTGRLFGTYYSRSAASADGQSNQRDENRLSMFGYTNLGRWYVMNFHQLQANLESQPGPHVLALSGTSYLPDSTRWHFDIPPQGVLQPEQKSKAAIQQSHFEFLPQYEEDRLGNRHPLRVSGMDDKLSQIRKVAEALAGDDYERTGAPLRRELRALQALAEEQPEYWADRDRLLLLVNSYDQAKWATQTIAARWSELSDKVFGLQRNEDDNLDTLIQGRELHRADIEQFAKTGGKILIAPLQAIGRGFNILNNEVTGKKAAFGAIYFLTRPMPHPFDTQAIAQELNRRTLDWFKDENFPAWQEDGLYCKGIALRREASRYWRTVENRRYYGQLSRNERRDLAATTAGLIIQACGRLLRGGVPFRAYFVDAAWGPNNARETGQPDTPKTSLLAAMIGILMEYSCPEDIIGFELYEPLTNALVDIENFDWKITKGEL